MLQDRNEDQGFADSQLEKDMHDVLQDAGCWRNCLPRIGVTRFFGIIERSQEHDSHEWHERLYGLMCACLDMGYLDKAIAEQARKSGVASSTGQASAASGSTSAAAAIVGSASSSSAQGARGMTAAKQDSVQIKKNNKSQIYHAFSMYVDVENRSKQWIIATVCGPLHEWHCQQNVQLRGVDGSREWIIEQCSGTYMVHVLETLKVVHSSCHMDQWGIEMDFNPKVHTNHEDAHCAFQDGLASYVGIMALSLASSRTRWGLDILEGWPKRSCLLCTGSQVTQDAAISQLRK